MKTAQKKRLAFLLGKTDRSAAEEAEYKRLEALALKEGLVLDSKFTTEFKLADGEAPPVEVKFNADGTAVEEPVALDDEQLGDVVKKAVEKALEGKSLTTDAIVAAIKGSLKPAEGAKGVTVESVNAAIAQHLKGLDIDPSAIVAAVRADLEGKSAPLTQAALDSTLALFAEKNLRSNSKNAYESGSPLAHFPIEHRLGNLSVGGKQLLNVILMKAPDEAFTDGKVRPKSISDGIDAKLLSSSAKAGEIGIKSMRQNITNALKFGGALGKALTTGSAGNGAELIPSDLSSELQMRLYLASALASQLLAGEIDMPTPTYQLPLKGARTRYYKGSENPGSNPTAGNPGTDDIILVAKKFIGSVEFSYEFDEDSIVPVIPMIQDDLALGAAAAFEDCVINGDTTATHMDSDIHAITNHASKNFKGLRKLCLAGGTAYAIAGPTAANVKALRKYMKKWGVKASECFIVGGPNAYNDFVGLDETLTLDKVGPQARILTGEAGFLFGMPIIVSESAREDLNASGVYDGSTDTKGAFFLVHRPSWYVGVRRGFTVEMDRDTRQQMNYITASFRRDFVPKETVAANTMPLVVMGYNYNA